ncbi:MAG: DUF2807 domain-containing protein [Defluviitaleaceae bacterium]|nr:DUF2807 domain-containing protein [Defluviitaleaceae bacterium]
MSKKNLTCILLIFVMAVTLVGCSAQSIRGIGSMVSQSFQVGDFTTININVPFIVIWQEQEQTSVTVEIQENLLEHLQISAQGNTLLVESGRPFEASSPNTPRMYITSPQIVGLSSTVAIATEKWDIVNSETFVMNLSGGAVVNIPLDVNYLEINIDEGGAYLTLNGNANTTDIFVTNGGISVSALALQTKDTRIDLTGGGVIDIAVANTLDITINGAGIIQYRGNPIITRNVIGVGSVSRID